MKPLNPLEIAPKFLGAFHIYNNMIDPNKIFSIFDSSENDDSEKKSETLYDYTEHPLYYLGMFKKIIMNDGTSDEQVLKKLSKIDKTLGANELKKAGEHFTYFRAYYFIDKIDLSFDPHCDALKVYYDVDLKKALKSSLKYFENIEEYEKCAHLKNILDYSEKNLEI
jgi:hypothetical protein